MKKYKFILKPLLFIFNLLFASWLVLEIEKINPSHFDKERSLLNNKHEIFTIPNNSMQRLKKLCLEYKAGLIDSTELEIQLEKLFNVSSKK
jgi:hypothetical protein